MGIRCLVLGGIRDIRAIRFIRFSGHVEITRVVLVWLLSMMRGVGTLEKKGGAKAIRYYERVERGEEEG